MNSLLLAGGRVVDPANKFDSIADVLILDGKISAIGKNLSAPAGVDFAVENQNVGNGIKFIGGINHTTAGEKQRIHRREFNRAANAVQARQW